MNVEVTAAELAADPSKYRGWLSAGDHRDAFVDAELVISWSDGTHIPVSPTLRYLLTPPPAKVERIAYEDIGRNVIGRNITWGSLNGDETYKLTSPITVLKLFFYSDSLQLVSSSGVHLLMHPGGWIEVEG